MALKIDKTTSANIVVSAAYARVENVTLLDKANISFKVRFYNDSTLPNTEVKVPFFTEEAFNCQYELNMANPIHQAYLYLKTLPEFASAVDC